MILPVFRAWYFNAVDLLTGNTMLYFGSFQTISYPCLQHLSAAVVITKLLGQTCPVPDTQHGVFTHWFPIQCSIAAIHHAHSHQTLNLVIYGYMLLSMDTKPFCLLTPKFNLRLCFKFIFKYCRELGL